MNSNVPKRPVTRMEIVEALADVARASFKEQLDRQTRTCLTCEKFNEPKELCEKYGGRPPARIIAFGCDGYEDKVPF